MDSHAHEIEIGMVAPNWGRLGRGRRHYHDALRVSVAAMESELGPCGEFDDCCDMGNRPEVGGGRGNDANFLNASRHPGPTRISADSDRAPITH